MPVERHQRRKKSGHNSYNSIVGNGKGDLIARNSVPGKRFPGLARASWRSLNKIKKP